MTYSTDLRIKCVNAYRRLGSLRKVASVVDVSKSSIQRWIHSLVPVKRARAMRKVSLAAQRLIAELLEERGACMRRADLVHEIRSRLNLALSASCIGTCIRREGFSWKKCTQDVTKVGLDQRRKEFALSFANLRPSEVVSIDETYIRFDMKPTYGYSKRGRRCLSLRRPDWKSHLTLLLAVSNEQVLGYQVLKGACDRSTFCRFVASLDAQGRKHLLMDNASIHKGACVQRAADQAGLTTLYLPPYSPMFQPVENVFSAFKAAYRRDPGPDADVDARVRRALGHVSRTNLLRTFASCWQIAASWL